MATTTPTIKTVVFQRPERDGGTIAVVHFHMVDAVKTPLERLKAALTAWVIGSHEGRKAWENNSEDFNVGDLSDWYGHSMMHYLNEQGITSIVFDSMRDNNTLVEYDEVLVNRHEVDTDEPVGSDEG